MTQTKVVNKPWSLSVDEVLKELDVNKENGLSESEVKRRRGRHGKNILKKVKRRSAFLILIDQFKSLVIAILAVAAALSYVFGNWVEGSAIMVAIVVNTAIGFFMENKAVKSMEALREYSRVIDRVKRDGKSKEVVAQELVPGDIVHFEAGDIITSDIRLFEASKLMVEESSLTGESTGVSKKTEKIDESAPLPERKNMIFKGTAVTQGSGKGVVVATGMKTELGEISGMVQETQSGLTPLEKRLDRLGHKLIWLTLALAVAVTIIGILRSENMVLMIKTGVALAVAAIPEGLPIVATVALARGMLRMADRNAVINRLASVETLGATNVIFSDKTGTLTKNKMTVKDVLTKCGHVEVKGDGKNESDQSNDNKFWRDDDERVDVDTNRPLKEAILVGVMCNNAALKHKEDGDEVEEPMGDPLEVALLVAGRKAGFVRDEVLEKMPEVKEFAFDPEKKMMATIHENESGLKAAVKGAPEAIFDACSHIMTDDDVKEFDKSNKDEWVEKSQKMAEEGLRVIAMATARIDDAEKEPYHDLTFLGLVGMKDPPREEVKESLNTCRRAGIKVIMVTGDQEPTARKIAESVGLVENSKDAKTIHGRDLADIGEAKNSFREDILECPIFVRISPKQKLDLISVYQDEGYIVAMTGDGVNDAPALKKADIGVAMGERGTQVAIESADMILKDDAFSTIVAAIEQGRAIFNNIRKFVLYLLSGNAGEIIVVGAASLGGLRLPLLPLQILFLNMVIDIFPALALGLGEAEKGIMNLPPRKSSEAIINRRYWTYIGFYGVIIAAAIMATFVICLKVLNLGYIESVTAAFLTLAFGRLFHIFNMRDITSGLIKNEITKNQYVWYAIVLCTVLILTAVFAPGLSDIIELSPPPPDVWALALAFSTVPLIVGQIMKVIEKRYKVD